MRKINSVIIPHSFRNRHLRNTGSGNITISGVSSQSVDTSIFLRKDQPDSTDHLIDFNGGITVENIPVGEILKQIIVNKDANGAVTSLGFKVSIYSEFGVSAKGLGSGGGTGGATTLGQLNNVGYWADDIPSVDRLLIQRAGSSNWSSINLSEIGGNYTLPTASASVLGGIKVGSGLSINASGVLSATNSYTLPTASASVLGGVKIGTTLDINSGVLNLKSGIVTPGTYPKLTVDTYGRVTGGASLAATDIPDLSAGKITSGTLPITRGGTGKTSIASGAMYYASAANVLSEIATSTFGRSLLNATSGRSFTGLVAEKATTLATARSIWGNSFNGSSNIGGTLIPLASATYDVGSASVLFRHGYFSGNITGGTANGAYLQLGNIRLKYDSSNNALYVEKSDGTAANLYATGAVSAKGVGSGGSGGGGLITAVYGYSDLGDLSKFSNSTLTDTFNAYTINRLANRLSSLETNVPLSFVTSGSGNAVTGVSKSGNVVTLLKDSTFSLSTHTHNYLTSLAPTDANNGYSSVAGFNMWSVWGTYTNTPTNSYTSGLFIGSPDAGYGWQIASPATTNQYLYFRKKNASTWGAWRYLIDSVNYTTLLDGRYILQSNEGNLNVASSKILKVFGTSLDSTALYTDAGTYFYQVSTSSVGWPTDNGMGLKLQRQAGTSVSTSQKVIDLWTRNGAANEELRYRTGAGDGTQMIYSAWYTLLHTGNYSSTLDSRYVLKSGDSVTGTLNFSSMSAATYAIILGTSKYISADGSNAMLWNDGTGTILGTQQHPTYLRSSSTNLIHRKVSTDYTIWDASNSNTTAVNWTGAVGSFDTLTIRSTSGVSHLSFSRSGYNYVTTGDAGVLCINTTSVASSTDGYLFNAEGLFYGITNTRTLGAAARRWSNIYGVLGNFSGVITSSVATGTAPLTVASTTVIPNLNADMLDGLHERVFARGGYVTYSAGLTQGWKRIAEFAGVAASVPFSGIITIGNSYNGNRNTAVTFMFSGSYQGNTTYSDIVQLGGNASVFTQARIVQGNNTTVRPGAYLEVYYGGSTTSSNTIFVTLSNARVANTTGVILYSTWEDGSIPENYTAFAKSFTSKAVSAWNGVFENNLTVSNNATITGNTTIGGNVIATGAITAKASSDRDLKTNFRDIDAGKMLSRMPIQLYDFKGIAKRINPHTPDSAISPVYQDAITILPSMDAKEKGDRYGSLNYLDTNYINLIGATAQQNYKKILNHEERIASLEKENRELKQIINKLKAA